MVTLGSVFLRVKSRDLNYLLLKSAVPFMPDEKIKIGSVSYLNAKPLLYSFENGGMNDQLEWELDHPAEIAGNLIRKEITIGLVPVAIIPQLQESYILGNFCIGAVQEVASVCLFSEVPMKDITAILLDYQSRTSVALLKILLKNYWKINPSLLPSSPGYEAKIGGTTAGLVIGDRAFEQRLKQTYCYDLAAAWIDHTGLPFVFAAWISNKKMPEDFIAAFDFHNSKGLLAIPELAKRYSLPSYDINRYFTQNISYLLDKPKREGLQLFLSLLS
jgi:chorismate dehydratase